MINTKMNLNQYIDTVNRRYKSGISREHSYRGDFENLFRELIKGVEITNEPTNVTDCGNPDYVITKGKIPIGYIEAKDIGKDLNSKSYKEQFSRYKKALDNLIITDYLWFQFFQNGDLVHEIRIAEIDNGTVKPLLENFSKFENLLSDFATFIGQTIKSSKKLAEMMAAKARLLQNILERAVTSDEETHENTSIQSQYSTFKQILIHDLTPKAFADIYAQTLAYGMFAARLHDPTLEDFSRQEAAELIPKSNPFLRKLFGYVAGPDIDERIKTTVDNLADVYRATNVEQLLKNFGATTQQNDPIIHFYETFLAEYDPKLRKSRGVWYTPEPVVKFIVRAVDDILKTEFGLSQGLADTSKTKIKLKVATHDKRSKSGYKQIDKEVHKVQILDPATGTGTFLAEIVKHIYNTRFKAMQGAWSGYVEEHLIPRLNGFELLMASYSMAHLKLDMLLTETGYKSTKNQRFNVFLTNSLEEHHPGTGTLFSNWLSTEANEANHIKRDTPVMCVIGNPPYAVSSNNRNEWIQNLIDIYKQNLNERKINIDDDYIKFIRYGQYFIDKNGEGVLAYISSNSFLDGVTHRQMRNNLLESFDSIFILDLHGNSKKKEVTPDGKPDQNVFDIMTGVSINVFIKNKSKSKTRGKVFHYDIYGTRNEKYNFLNSNSIESIRWNELKCTEPYYFYVPKDFSKEIAYQKGINLEEFFLNRNTGIQTKNDSLTLCFSKEEILSLEEDFLNLNLEELRHKYGIKDGTWKLENAKNDLLSGNYNHVKILVKAFDTRYTLLNRKSSGFLGRPRYGTMKHMIPTDNLALLVSRQNKSNSIDSFFITDSCSEMKSAERTIQSYHFPLYLYNEDREQKLLGQDTIREPNLDRAIIEKICKAISIGFSSEKESTKDNFAPIDILDYIYAILYSPSYREKFKEFLKIDFPRIPYPKDKETFWQLVELGEEIRQIHLLESPKVEEYITSYPKDGDNAITRKVVTKDWELFDEENQLGRIWINDEQYFDNIPLTIWEFYIGGYQPAQKWLKDRKGRTLNFDDILHYQKIIVALNETVRLMKEIDEIKIE